jgi:adenylosuccinate synthase
LLDEWYGFHPYTTWSTTTFANATALLSEIDVRAGIRKIGVVRSYATRHGAGPFPSEDRRLLLQTTEPHNGEGLWQGAFRKGWLDLILLRYAQEVSGGADEIALTHADVADAGPMQIVTSYRSRYGAAVDPQIAVSDDGIIRRLVQKQMLTDLVPQERLTSLLQKVIPVAEPILGRNDLIARIERELAPVTIVSNGPTAAHKVLRVAPLKKLA